MCSTKRKRCNNFNVTEVDALITLIEEFQGVLGDYQHLRLVFCKVIIYNNISRV